MMDDLNETAKKYDMEISKDERQSDERVKEKEWEALTYLPLHFDIKKNRTR